MMAKNDMASADLHIINCEIAAWEAESHNKIIRAGKKPSDKSTNSEK